MWCGIKHGVYRLENSFHLTLLRQEKKRQNGLHTIKCVSVSLPDTCPSICMYKQLARCSLSKVICRFISLPYCASNYWQKKKLVQYFKKVSFYWQPYALFVCSCQHICNWGYKTDADCICNINVFPNSGHDVDINKSFRLKCVCVYSSLFSSIVWLVCLISFKPQKMFYR